MIVQSRFNSTLLTLSILSVLIMHLNGILLVGLPSEYDLLFPQGNEYKQSSMLFSRPSRLNATDYFLDIERCLVYDPKPLVCTNFANKYHREFSRLWQPKKQSVERYPRMQRDCQYENGNFSASKSGSVALLFTYTIQQHSCQSSAQSNGGATWELFGLDTSALAFCSYIDQLDNIYKVTCSLPIIPTSSDAPIKACINITTVLMYEHFDGLSEVMLDWSHHYPPLRTVIADNLQYCVDHSQVRMTENMDAQQNQGLGIWIPNSVQWHSGLWLFNQNISVTKPSHMNEILSLTTAQSNLFYSFNPISGSSAYLYHSFREFNTNYTTFPDTTLKTMTALSMRSPFATSYRYAFQPLLLSQRGNLPTFYGTNSSCQSKRWNASICNIVEISDIDDKPSVGYPDSVIDERTFLRNFTYGAMLSDLKVAIDKDSNKSVNDVLNDGLEENLAYSRMQYHFVGASHMRYLFDSVCEYFFGVDILKDIPRKHDALKLANMRYNFIANARHQVMFLSKMCAVLENETLSANEEVRSRNHTLVFQTGAWDLSVASLRRILNDPAVGKKLMDMFEGIMTGRHPCGRIKHIVWLTSVPHAVCFDDGFVNCNGHRSYRINSAINVVNQFYLKNLFGVTNTIEENLAYRVRGLSLPRLSVVDAFSIIKPRLVFDESGEVVCTNHFSCRYASGHNFDFAEGHANILVHSPGGMAMVKSVLNALSL